MYLKGLKLGDHRTNTYIFGTDIENIAVIDPGYEGDEIYKVIKEDKLNVKYIILTHGHYDHIGQVKHIKELTGAKVLIHQNDAEMLIDAYQNLSAYVSNNHVVAVKADKIIDDNENISLGDSNMQIIHTPGHTKGGICILYGDSLFSGDTLFKETVGRVDLPHSSFNDMVKSIEKLMKLKDNINVYPGHGDYTTIAHERKNNPFVKE